MKTDQVRGNHLKERRANGTFASRDAECHPEKRHKGNGLCVTCYSRERARRNQPENRERSRRWYANNREKSIAAAVQWARDNRAKHRQNVLKYHYGLTVGQEEALLIAQGGLCAVCLEPFGEERHRRPSVDHDHATGEIRGLLHVTCNSALGMLRESPDNFRRAIEYLASPPARRVL